MKKNKIFLVVLALAVLAGLAVLWHYGYKNYMKSAYPLKYKQIVLKYSRENGISPSLVFAVIKNESGFNPNAESSIGARGLMQLTPDTFWWAQSKTGGSKGLNDDSLFDPEINVKYGTAVLSHLISEFGRCDTALASYHAGRTNVKKWLADKKYSSDRKKLDYIPFADTRVYVKKVLETEKIYNDLYKY